MRKLRCLVIPFALLISCALSGCTTCTQDHHALAQPEPLKPSEGLVLVADGAGDFRATSHAFRQGIAAEKLPLHVETFVWSHGYYRVLADQLDQEHICEMAKSLAQRIASVRQASMQRPIYLVAHSAGSAVALAAAAELPPDTIDRIILLAPAVPADYDLRPALRSVRLEIDVFTSRADRWYLRGSDLVSSLAHWKSLTAAGRCGFRPILQSPDDGLLYSKLRDYPWEPRLIWTGHDGGHFGFYQQGYLRAFILPLLSARSPGAIREASANP